MPRKSHKSWRSLAPIGGMTIAAASLMACGSSQTLAVDRTLPPTATEEVADNKDLSASNAGPCSVESIHFGYDSSDLSSHARSRIGQNANCLKERGVDQVNVTGHTDPRGTEEYNLALGDRRARAVAEYIDTLGVKAQAASLGEEVATGTDESSWAQDRRAEFRAKAAQQAASAAPSSKVAATEKTEKSEK